jgi:hypothetical protein
VCVGERKREKHRKTGRERQAERGCFCVFAGVEEMIKL